MFTAAAAAGSLLNYSSWQNQNLQAFLPSGPGFDKQFEDMTQAVATTRAAAAACSLKNDQAASIIASFSQL